MGWVLQLPWASPPCLVCCLQPALRCDMDLAGCEGGSTAGLSPGNFSQLVSMSVTVTSLVAWSERWRRAGRHRRPIARLLVHPSRHCHVHSDHRGAVGTLQVCAAAVVASHELLAYALKEAPRMRTC